MSVTREEWTDGAQSPTAMFREMCRAMRRTHVIDTGPSYTTDKGGSLAQEAARFAYESCRIDAHKTCYSPTARGVINTAVEWQNCVVPRPECYRAREGCLGFQLLHFGYLGFVSATWHSPADGHVAAPIFDPAVLGRFAAGYKIWSGDRF